MSAQSGLPDDLAELFAGADTKDLTLSVALPPGKLVHGEEGTDERPALWVSDQPASAGLWSQLRAQHDRSGLWPLLLDTLHGDPARPWDDGELWPMSMSSPEEHDAERLLGHWWSSYTQTDDDGDMLSAAERIAVTAPFEKQWPGLAASRQQQAAPDEQADRCATELLRDNPALRIGLVPASRGSDALAAAGWQGPANYTNDTAELSAVLRTWEDRFGARVVAVGFAELYLSVAAPVRNVDEALPVAAEHFAFCPDNVWQGAPPYTLSSYAERLVDASMWSFWWD